MRGQQIVVGVAAWLLAVVSVASLSWVAIDSAGHEVARHDGLSRDTALRPAPFPTPAADAPVALSVPSPSRSVTKAPSARAKPASLPTATPHSRRARVRPEGSTATSPPHWSRWAGDVHGGAEATTPARTTDDRDPAVTPVPVGADGGDEFERWLGSLAVDGSRSPGGISSSAGFWPWWYGRSGGTWADTAWTSRSLLLDGGLVWASCAGTQLRRWSASPQDGWVVRTGLERSYLQAQFRSGAGTVEVQAGCVGSRPAFRYRATATGSTSAGGWRSSLT
jgi:hypothetical protein